MSNSSIFSRRNLSYEFSLSLLPTDTHYMSLCDFLRCTSSFLVWTDFYYFALLDIMKACKNVLGYIQKMPSFLMMKLIN